MHIAANHYNLGLMIMILGWALQHAKFAKLQFFIILCL